jgi:thioredoxin 1
MIRTIFSAFLTLMLVSGFSQDTSGVYKGLSVQEFKQIVGRSNLVLVNFSADWCVVCKRQKPVLDEIASSFAGSVKVMELDMKDNPLIAEYFEVDGLPVNIIYKKGNMVWNRMGFQNRQQLSELLRSYR